MKRYWFNRHVQMLQESTRGPSHFAAEPIDWRMWIIVDDGKTLFILRFQVSDGSGDVIRLRMGP